MFAKIISFFIVVLVSVSAVAGPKIEQWQTSNGGRVYFVAAPELPMIDIQVIFDAGSARDGDLPGVALLTNALLNEGAAGFSADTIAAAFEDVGAQFGNSSARDMAALSLRSLTSEDELTPALNMFESVLSLPDFPQTSFDRIQKQMVLGLQAEKQSPGAIAARAFYSNLYGNHPYGSMSAGTDESVKRLTVEAVKAFYKQYYVANNAVVVLVGAIDKQQAMTIAEKLLKRLPQGEKPIPLMEVKPLDKPKKVEIEYPSTQTHILMGQPGIRRGDADYFPLYVGNHILGGSGLVSKLSDEIREKRGLSYSVYSYFNPMRAAGPYQFGLQTRNDQAEQALEVLKSTLNTFIKEGVSEAELTAAKQNITGGFALRIDSNSKISGYLAMIGFYGLPLDYLDTFKANINAVTAQQIKDAYLRRVQADKMITVMVGGKE